MQVKNTDAESIKYNRYIYENNTTYIHESWSQDLHYIDSEWRYQYIITSGNLKNGEPRVRYIWCHCHWNSLCENIHDCLDCAQVSKNIEKKIEHIFVLINISCNGKVKLGTFPIYIEISNSLYWQWQCEWDREGGNN